MSYNIHFSDHGMGLILKRTAGSAANTSDFANAVVTFFQENREALPAIRYVYIDYTKADKMKVGMEDILRFVELAKIIAAMNNKLIVAICAPQFDNYCMTKRWEVTLPEHFDWVTMAFRDKDKAHAWLKKSVQEELVFE